MGIYLRVLSEGYSMNTNMTWFGWFSNICVLWTKVVLALEELITLRKSTSRKKCMGEGNASMFRPNSNDCIFQKYHAYNTLEYQKDPNKIYFYTPPTMIYPKDPTYYDFEFLRIPIMF